MRTLNKSLQRSGQVLYPLHGHGNGPIWDFPETPGHIREVACELNLSHWRILLTDKKLLIANALLLSWVSKRDT
jgi:hypothetical protein